MMTLARSLRQLLTRAVTALLGAAVAVVALPPPQPTAAAETAFPSPDPAADQVAQRSGRCDTSPPPALRIGGSLTVRSPAPPVTPVGGARLRSHVSGPLGAGEAREWTGPPVPAFIPIAIASLELFLLERDGDEYVALYRDPYDANSCQLRGPSPWRNCAYELRVFHCSGQPLATLPLTPLLSYPDHLEIQDMRYADGVAYFNEGCQSYAREAKGACSSLVALDVRSGRVRWRTPPLTSNGWFLLHQKYIIAGYGFTAEPDALFIVRRADGKVLQKVPLAAAHATLSIDAQEVLTVLDHRDGQSRFRLVGFDGPQPRLLPLSRPPRPTVPLRPPG